MAPRDEARRVLNAIRRQIKRSPLSQRQVEARAGFSRGYLSQVLTENLDLKFVHVVAVLDALGVTPTDFFAELYPRAAGTALERFGQRSRLPSVDVRKRIGELYGEGVESLGDLRSRLERCERAVDQLERLGVLGEQRRAGGSDDRRGQS